MAEQRLWFLVSYDVRDAKRLRKVAKHLEGYGVRLQYSGFRCRLSERQVERLRWELAQILDNEDDLLVIGLCSRCGERVGRMSGSNEWTEQPVSFEII